MTLILHFSQHLQASIGPLRFVPFQHNHQIEKITNPEPLCQVD